MKTLAFYTLVIVAGGFSTAIYIRTQIARTRPLPSSAMFHCSQGEVTGIEQFTDHIKQLSDSCYDHLPEVHLYYNCIVRTVGSFNDDGKADMKLIEKYYKNTFDDSLFEKMPEFRDSLIKCGENFVSAYNGLSIVEAENGNLTETFVYCFMDNVEKFSDDGDDVCVMEEEDEFDD